MIAYHFLKDDLTSGYGAEPPWTVGEERTVKTRRKKLVLCKVGYHSSPTLFDALQYTPGPMACIVEVSEPEAKDETKQVSRTRKLVAAVNVERELRLFACDCAERALLRERERGREPDPRSWKAVEVARLYIHEAASLEEMSAAANAAYAAYDATNATYAAYAAYAATYATYAAYAATYATYAAYDDAAAARQSEREWQRAHFDELVTARLEQVALEGAQK